MIEVSFILNGKQVKSLTDEDAMLINLLRNLKCYSVKCGCETTNCGLCTVIFDNKPVLSCAVPAFRAEGHVITTLEGLQSEAEEFGAFMADEGSEQCGFCNPGFIMNVIAMTRELENPSEDEIKEYLSGNLCRCTGYVSHMRAIKKYLEFKRGECKC